MIPAQSRTDSGVWSIAGHRIRIEYARSVLAEIAGHVIEGHEKYLGGGQEVGGVLFGRHADDTVRILAFRPFELVPPKPRFALSPDDSRRLRDSIASWLKEPDLAGLEAVGWYHSHTREEIFLSETDLETYDRDFPEPWQVAMVLRPRDDEPVRVGFFFRESDGFIRTDQSYREFMVERPESVPAFRSSPPWPLDEEGFPPEDVLPSPATQAEATPKQASQPAFSIRWTKWLLAMAAGIAIIAGTLSVLWLRYPGAPLGLELRPGDEGLAIRWDPQSPSFRDASGTTLLIEDGGRRSALSLDAAQIARGLRIYHPSGNRVDVRMRVSFGFGRMKEEIATFYEHPRKRAPSPELVAARNELRELESEAASLNEQLLQRQQETARLETVFQEKLVALKIAKAPPQPVSVKILAAAMRPAPRRLQWGSRPAPTKGELPAGPEVSRSAALPASPPALSQEPLPPPPAPTLPAVRLPDVPAADAAPPKRLTAFAGRLIWTGDLPRGAVLTIDGSRSSAGSLIGELPGAPVQIGVYPAQMSEQGLKIFSANPALRRASRVEPPSASNGWNPTEWVYDEKAVRDVWVEEAPERGAPKRLVLRVGGRRLSMIVIEWRVIAP